MSNFDDLRELWNKFDPIGVTDESIDDEYDAYVSPYISLLEQQSSESDLRKYVEKTVYEQMGLEKNADLNAGIDDFIKQTVQWFNEK